MFIQALLGAGGGLHVPLAEGGAEGGGDLVGEDGLAGAGFPFDEEGRWMAAAALTATSRSREAMQRKQCSVALTVVA